MANCFTLTRAIPFRGIEGIVVRGGKSYLDLSDGLGEQVSLPVGHGSREVIPHLSGVKLLQADAVFDEETKKIVGLVKSVGRQVALLRVKTLELDFGDKYRQLRENFASSSLWLGGEGVRVPFAQSGDRRGFDQDQLFALSEGDRLLVVDKFARVIVYFIRGGAFMVKQAVDADVVAHINGRAPYMDSLKEVGWGLKILLALDATDKRADKLIARARELERGFHMNWDDYR